MAFLEEGLGLTREMHVLDVGCGWGRHAMELASRGYRVTGIDLSLALLIRAADEAQRRGLQVNFVHGDMRELAFDDPFDAAYCMGTSFGFFDDDSNRKVAQGLAQVVRAGGRLLVEVVNRDYIIGDLPARVWWEGDGCVVLEEVEFNYYTSRLVVRRSVVFEDGRQLEHDISVRVYSLHEVGRLLQYAGFRVLDVSGHLSMRGRFFGAASRQILVVAERRSTPLAD
ncbi:MAG: class I SAM-dependent methyltransferase [Deltaproteobacteria bacterium]|nr:class I SAM-dependent methyltransferase [Deltaproteobacteria bacterium]